MVLEVMRYSIDRDDDFVGRRTRVVPIAVWLMCPSTARGAAVVVLRRSNNFLMTGDGRAMHHSAGSPIVGPDSVQSARIVPNHEVSLRPFVSIVEIRLRRPFDQTSKYRTAVGSRHAHDEISRCADDE